MKREVFYMAHPVRPNMDEIDAERISERSRWSTFSDAWFAARATDRNVKRAMRWLTWLRRSFPESTFIAPWIASLLAGDDDSDPAMREAGFVDDCAVVQRCDGFVMVGGRISDGMKREADAHRYIMETRGEGVFDLTWLGAEPPWIRRPESMESPDPFREWWERNRKRSE